MTDHLIETTSVKNVQAPVRSGLWPIIQAKLGYLAWIQVVVATLGSLYFSEVMHFVPCILCWYQRILMYPLVLIVTVGLLLRDSRLRLYVLPMSFLGFAISFYHILLQYNVISDGVTQCTGAVSCTIPWINWFGFITIPLLSFLAFSIVSLCMIFYERAED